MTTSELRCHGDRSAFCRMEILQQYCSLPSFQRMCCKSCKLANSTNPTTTTSKPPSKSKTITKVRTTHNPKHTTIQTSFSTSTPQLHTTAAPIYQNTTTPYYKHTTETSTEDDEHASRTYPSASDAHEYTTAPIYQNTTTLYHNHTMKTSTEDKHVSSVGTPRIYKSTSEHTIALIHQNTTTPYYTNTTETSTEDDEHASRIYASTPDTPEYTTAPIFQYTSIIYDHIMETSTEENDSVSTPWVYSTSETLEHSTSSVSQYTATPVYNHATVDPPEQSAVFTVGTESGMSSTSGNGLEISTELSVSIATPLISTNNALIPSNTDFKEFDEESSGVPNVDNDALSQTTAEYKSDSTTSGDMVVSSIALTTSTPSVSTASSAVQTNTTASGGVDKAEETTESNAIDIPYHIIPPDSRFPPNNIIPRRGRVFLREKTRNKRIQELLEEKRIFLRRMKREQGI